MLKHPTLDQLSALGLHGMAKAFAELAANGEAGRLGHHEWLGLLLDREASWRQDKRGCASPNCANRPASKISIIVVPAALTARGSKSWSKASGSTPMTIWFSSGRPSPIHNAHLAISLKVQG